MILAVMDNYMHMAQPWLQTGAFQAMLLDFYPNRALQDKPRSVLTLMNKPHTRCKAHCLKHGVEEGPIPHTGDANRPYPPIEYACGP